MGTAQPPLSRAWGTRGLGLLLRPQALSQLGFPFLSQLEATLGEKSQQLEGLQEMKTTLEEQLKREAAAKVMFLRVT